MKAIIKDFLRSFHSHHKKDKDIFILTLPRSGSTLISEILNTDKQIKTCGEPFGLSNQNKKILSGYFPHSFLRERYSDVTSGEFQMLVEYIEDLSKGKTWNAFYWADFPGKYHSFSTIRTAFKIHKLNYLLDELAMHFQHEHFIYFLRHPLSHSFSRIRNQWTTYHDQFIHAEKVKANIPKDRIQQITKIFNSGNELEKFVVSWCLENFTFFHLLKKQALPENVIYLSYEELVMDLENVIPHLCSKTGVPFSDDMIHVAGKPSRGIVHSTKITKIQIREGQVKQHINQWRKHISPEKEKKAFDILSLFNITYYQAGENLPVSSFLHR